MDRAKVKSGEYLHSLDQTCHDMTAGNQCKNLLF